MDLDEVKKKEIETKKKFIKFLVWSKWQYKVTDSQANIIRKIVFQENEVGEPCKRFSICAYTQHGKTWSCSLAISILIDSQKCKVAFIGPKSEQAGILREYMNDMIYSDESLLSKAMINTRGAEYIKTEASKKRMTFTNGSEYRVFSAEGDANRLMGFGVGINDGLGIIVKDEACLIPGPANAKIGRMMGNNPENCILIELYNPWSRDNVTYLNSLKSNFDVTHIGWRQGVNEGRTTEAFVMTQKDDLTKVEFEVLYDSIFPTSGIDTVFSMEDIEVAQNNDFPDDERDTVEIGVDIARYGNDRTTIYSRCGKCIRKEYVLKGFDLMTTTGHITSLLHNKFYHYRKRIVNVDETGMGSGVVDRLREINKTGELRCEVNGVNNGSKPKDEKRFINKVSEMWLWVAKYIKEYDLEDDKDLILQLTSRKYNIDDSKGRIKIESKKDIKKKGIGSPDHADGFILSFTSLIYSQVGQKKGRAYAC